MGREDGRARPEAETQGPLGKGRAAQGGAGLRARGSVGRERLCGRLRLKSQLPAQGRAWSSRVSTQRQTKLTVGSGPLAAISPVPALQCWDPAGTHRFSVPCP